MEALTKIYEWLRFMVARNASDLFITAGFPPAIKLNGKVTPITKQSLTPTDSAMLAKAIMSEKQHADFMTTHEANFAIYEPEIGRFRVNVFQQQGRTGMVLRHINTTIPKLEDLHLPPGLKDISMMPRGLVIVVGATGSGKSTTLAAMVGHRNQNAQDHIVTVEDPIEYVHTHGKSIITQREVGMDTLDWEAALKNTLRQAPDVIMIGEIRDRDTMQYAMAYAETGHLCLSTIHANNANQALDRILSFFAERTARAIAAGPVAEPAGHHLAAPGPAHRQEGPHPGGGNSC
jgi:twitching motility protein PilU